jgi:hypothetical protein
MHRLRVPARSRASLVVSSLVLATACGGSGSSSPPPPTCADSHSCPDLHVARAGIEVASGSTLVLAPTRVNGHAELAVSLASAGGSDLVFTGTPAVQLSGPDAAQFAIAAQPPAGPLAPAAETSFTLRFDPTSAGTKTATVSIATNAPGSPFTFAVEAHGRASIWLFRSAADHGGNLGGRTGADGICAADYAASFDALGCGTVHAFLTVSGTDRITGIAAPASLDVRTAADVQIETSWANLWDGNALPTTLASLGAAPWWSGADNAGAPMQTCGGWTNGGTTDGGTLGSTTATTTWLWRGALRCDFPASLLCVCW